MEYLDFFLKAFVAVFIIVDPPGNIPLYLSLTETATEEERQIISKKATLIAAILLLILTVTGNFILEIFKVTLDGLRIAGGILLFTISIDILLGERRKRKYVEESRESIDVDSLATFPIALPLYTGPGAITAAIVLYSTAEDLVLKILVLLSIIVTYLIVRITHVYSIKIVRVLGRSGSNIIARLMAIFLAAIAVEYFFTGLLGKLALL
ncbi:hypothetical protein AKJ37_00430 [candidate division MSBL1 archaeon SCGC-AAA259I09]|uniref:UPF0056 membrane protein n=3 Tax=candidate division MSBL1 TaxID=215777 RepID=A0A133USS0_9EURY|nr:hypothetical protein AKJ36_00415 [candidate division MSBL1 archaeon SCGC-AAA259I07]KXA97282.1 hypothetical protein AKJ38_01600 [candidate division MSBL1 archaeon SCGC-AAA259I14]KXA98373.1 hypothetical protein AKJ37_00430 [candidate division MSBL1 archaeon SCGC-AAA259I09]